MSKKQNCKTFGEKKEERDLVDVLLAQMEIKRSFNKLKYLFEILFNILK